MTQDNTTVDDPILTSYADGSVNISSNNTGNNNKVFHPVLWSNEVGLMIDSYNTDRRQIEGEKQNRREEREEKMLS